jgi:hypothetical protein
MGSRAAARQHKSAGQPREGRSESGKGTRAGISRFECIEEAELVAVSFMSGVAIPWLTARAEGERNLFNWLLPSRPSVDRNHNSVHQGTSMSYQRYQPMEIDRMFQSRAHEQSRRTPNLLTGIWRLMSLYASTQVRFDSQAKRIIGAAAFIAAGRRLRCEEIQQDPRARVAGWEQAVRRCGFGGCGNGTSAAFVV